jgi:hypothetical protein
VRNDEGKMLKITKIDTQDEQRIVFEGCLIEPWTCDLGSHWEQARHNQPGRKFTVDLRGVTRIDRSGECALIQMKSAGAEFLARGMRIKYLLKTLECQVDERRSRGGPEEPAEIDRGKNGRNDSAA